MPIVNHVGDLLFASYRFCFVYYYNSFHIQYSFNKISWGLWLQNTISSLIVLWSVSRLDVLFIFVNKRGSIKRICFLFGRKSNYQSRIPWPAVRVRVEINWILRCEEMECLVRCRLTFFTYEVSRYKRPRAIVWILGERFLITVGIQLHNAIHLGT